MLIELEKNIARLFDDPAPQIPAGPAQDFFAMAQALRAAVEAGKKPWSEHATARDYAAIMHWAIRKQEYSFAAQTLAELDAGKKKFVALDLGCGVVPFGHFMARRGHQVWAVDPLTTDLALLAQGRGEKLFGGAVHYAAACGETLPFGDGRFDVIACVSVFEHLVPGNDRLTLREVARVLKPGGHLIITFDIAPPRALEAGEGALPARMRHYENAYAPDEARALFDAAADYFDLPRDILPSAADALTWGDVRRFWRAAQEGDGRAMAERPYLAAGLVLKRNRKSVREDAADFERWLLLGQTALRERMEFFRAAAAQRADALDQHARHVAALTEQVQAELRLLLAQRQAAEEQRQDLGKAQALAAERFKAFEAAATKLQSAWNAQITSLEDERRALIAALSHERAEQGRLLAQERKEQITALAQERQALTQALSHERAEQGQLLAQERETQLRALSAERHEQMNALSAERQAHAETWSRLMKAQLDAHADALAAQRADVVAMQAHLSDLLQRLAQLESNRAHDRAQQEAQLNALRQWIVETTETQNRHLADMTDRLAVVAARLEHFHVEAERRSLPGLLRRAKGRILGLPRAMRHAPARLREKFAVRLGVFYQYPPRPLGRYRVADTPPPADPAPKISIVTPSYNQGGYIGQTIVSVLGQYYPNLEYIVQDGGSTDHTLDIIQPFASRLTHWESKPDKGQTDAINKGFARTSGDIMAWLNSDDLLLPGSLNFAARYFAENPDVDLIYGHRVIINEVGDEVGVWIMPPHDKKTLAYADYIPQETMFWRRRVWEKLGGLDDGFRFAMDWDFLLRVQDAGFVMRRVPYFLGAFRVHAAQKTHAEINSVGEAEMKRLRERALGHAPSQAEIERKIRPFLRRHVRTHLAYRMGWAKF